MTLPDDPEPPDVAGAPPPLPPPPPPPLTPDTNADLEAFYPGVYTAFELIIPSYQLAERRLQAVDGWLQNLQAFTVTLTVGATVLASGVVDDISFSSPLFFIAMATAGLSISTGLVGRAFAEIKLISPRRIFDEGLIAKDEWTFKKDLLYAAGDDYEYNRRVVEQKSFAAQVMTALFLLEALLLVIWVLVER